MENNILIKHPKNWGLDESLVLRLARKALEEFKGREQACLFTTGNIELSIYFVGKAKAKKLNQDYRQKDYIPQVLGFPMSTEADADGVIRLGDIVICTQKLKYEVVFQKKTLEEVLYEWLVHGVENLLKG